MLSKLRPDSATEVGLLTAAGVYLVYQNALPSVTDVRASMPHNEDAERTRKAAAWKATILIGAVFLVARDLNSFIISGAALVGIDYMYKHANAIHPMTQTLATDADSFAAVPGMVSGGMDEYADAGNEY